jgi:hypothetical protein
MFTTAKRVRERGSRPNRILTRQPPGACRLFVGFPDDRRIEVVVRFVVFVLGIIIIIVGVRGGIVLPMMVTILQSTNQMETFSGMPWVMSAPVGCRDIHGRMLARDLGVGKAFASWRAGLMGPGPQRAAAATRALMSFKRASRSRLRTPSKSDPWLEVRSLEDFDFKQL